MTKPSQKRKTFTRNNFAEHNYNYVNRPQTTQPSRTNTQNYLFSQGSIFPQPASNSVNFHDYPEISQDKSENYPFLQHNRIDNKHLIIHLIIYHQMMMTTINQIFLQHIHRNTVYKNIDQI